MSFDVVIDFARNIALGVRYARMFMINGVAIFDIIMIYVALEMGLALFTFFLSTVVKMIPGNSGLTVGTAFMSMGEREEYADFFQGEDQDFVSDYEMEGRHDERYGSND